MNSLKKLKRTARTAEVLARYGLAELFDRSSLDKLIPRRTLARYPVLENIRNQSIYERVRMAMEELGPAYVKLGQMLSNRSDILPAELIDELQKLQDKVEVQPVNIRAKLANELGIAPEEYFAELGSEPIASASIGQVFRGVLTNGRTVVLKVKREGIAETIEADLLIIKDLGTFLEKRGGVFKQINLSCLLAAFEQSLQREISFAHESANIQRFARNFRHDTRVFVPQVYSELSNNNILCMDFVSGCKVSDQTALLSYGFEPTDIATLGLDVYMQQVLVHGFFHADPHPGNILLQPDGKIAFIDFGAMGILLPPEREQLESFILHAMRKNVKKVIANIKNIALEYDVANEQLLERELYELLELADSASLNALHLGDMLNKVAAILSRNRVVLPENMYLLIKGFVQIEGIGRLLNPNLQIFEAMKPYGERVLWRRFSPQNLLHGGLNQLEDTAENWLMLPAEVRTFLHKIQNKDIRLEHELQGLPQLRRTFDRLALAMIAAALFIASSILMLAAMPPKIYGVPLFGLLGFLAAAVLTMVIVVRRE